MDEYKDVFAHFVRYLQACEYHIPVRACGPKSVNKSD